MKTYNLIFMSFDGKYVIDSKHNSIEAANEASDIGSKWFFYPFCFITSGKTIKETGIGLINMKTKVPYMEAMFKGKRLTTVIKEFKKANEICIAESINADCYKFEEILIYNVLRS